MFQIATARKTNKTDANNNKQSIITRVGRGFAHKNAEGMNVLLDRNPVLGDHTRLLIFAEKEGNFNAQPAQLGVYDVQEYSKDGEEKKQWVRIGTAFRSKNGRAYEVRLDALPKDGKMTLIVPTKKVEGETPSQVAVPESVLPETDELPF